MFDPVDPPDSLLGDTGDALKACALDQGDSGPVQLDDVRAESPIQAELVAPEARAEVQTTSEIALAALGRTKRKRMARNLPEVSEARVQELAAEYAGIDPGQNAKVMKYARESPPLPPEARAAFAQLVTIKHPDAPGLYYFWFGDRIVYVGKSRAGLMGNHLCASTQTFARYGSQVKIFDALTFQPCPEDLLDVAVGAVVRWLRPKYNRGTKLRGAPTVGDQAVLDLLFSARAA